MPKIPDEEIQRLKREVSLVRLCERYGIDLKPQGKNLVGFCPWHKDDKPSFIVTPEKNLWHCMGACDEGGDVFSLVRKAENVSFRRAADILLEISGSMPRSQVIKPHKGEREMTEKEKTESTGKVSLTTTDIELPADVQERCIMLSFDKSGLLNDQSRKMKGES